MRPRPDKTAATRPNSGPNITSVRPALAVEIYYNYCERNGYHSTYANCRGSARTIRVDRLHGEHTTVEAKRCRPTGRPRNAKPPSPRAERLSAGRRRVPSVARGGGAIERTGGRAGVGHDAVAEHALSERRACLGGTDGRVWRASEGFE